MHLKFSIFFIFKLISLFFLFPIIYYYQKRGLDEKKKNLVFKVNKKFARQIFKVSKTNIEIIGKENIPKDETVLFVSNHQSYLDIPLIYHVCDKPLGYVAKLELLKVPILGKWIKYTDSVFIDRKNIRQSLKAINKASDNIKKNHSMVIFPEGTRSKSSDINPFKPGSLKIAEKAKSPIVPITIIDSYTMFEGNNKRIKSSNIKVIISKPINTENIKKDEDNKKIDFSIIAFNEIKNNLNKYKK